MTIARITFSPTANIDIEFEMPDALLTVEAKSASGALTLEWLATGWNTEKKLCALFSARIGCSAMTEEGAFKEAQDMVEQISRLVETSRTSPGLANALSDWMSPENLERRAAYLLDKHLADAHHQSEIDTAAKKTAIQVHFCKSIGLTKFIDFLARFESVPISTIRRRVDNARSLGLIPKRGGSDG